jgi:hypothetical protein|tara:strand:+ start:626 stop:973 length:348 start_codon:yes stop_codon:yes gene_type:complete
VDGEKTQVKKQISKIIYPRFKRGYGRLVHRDYFRCMEVKINKNKNMYNKNNNNNSVWTDTKGIAEHFSLKPNTLRKQRVQQSSTTLPHHQIGGSIRYNILECEKFVNDNKKEYQT